MASRWRRARVERLATLQISSDVPELSAVESLAGWRREFCVELLGDAGARVFVRKVEQSSFKATELQRGTLFYRLPPQFRDLAGCLDAIGVDLRTLVEMARRTRPDTANLFASVVYDRSAWDRVQRGIEQWGRQQRP